jgi:hypothetical protein
MYGTRCKNLLNLALLTGALAACDSATGPEESPAFDAQAALEDYQVMEDILASNVMAGFRAMATGVSLESLGPVPSMVIASGADLAAPPTAENARACARRILEAAATPLPGPSANPIISPFNRGKTFAFDPDLGRYAHDPDRTDAPPNGVRWVLYEDNGKGQPDPAREIGYVDLVDEGDGSAEDIALSLVAVVDGETRLDYRTTVDVLDQGGRVTVHGFIRGEDPADRLDFEIEASGSEGGGQASMDVEFEMRVDSRAFRIDGSVEGIQEGTSDAGAVDLLVEHGPESLRIQATGTEEGIDGTFYLHGELFATVSGDPDNPTFEGATGQPLTWAEALVLHHMVDTAEDVFDLFEDLLDPVDELVILALIL